jgi:hypothetical protein
MDVCRVHVWRVSLRELIFLGEIRGCLSIRRFRYKSLVLHPWRGDLALNLDLKLDEDLLELNGQAMPTKNKLPSSLSA